jgi:hypothetical protein
MPVFKDISIWLFKDISMITRLLFFNFWTKWYKIVEILALLAAELSSSKIYKVGYVILHSIGFIFEHGTLLESFLNVH